MIDKQRYRDIGKNSLSIRITKYSRISLWRGPIYHDITYITAMTTAEQKPDTELTKL